MSRRVRLDVSIISDRAYEAILQALKAQFGKDMFFENWEISADITTEEESEEESLNYRGETKKEAFARSSAWTEEVKIVEDGPVDWPKKGEEDAPLPSQ